MPHGRFAQVAARLWDVAPDGTQTLVSHGIYRPRTEKRRPAGLPAPPERLALRGRSRAEARAARPERAVRSRGRRTLHDHRRAPRAAAAGAEAPDGGAIVAPAAPVVPASVVELPDAGVPQCGTAPAAGCTASRTSRLRWGKKTLEWTWKGRGAERVGAPDLVTGYRLCVWDKTTLAASAVVEPGACQEGDRTGACWTQARRKPLTYRDADAATLGAAFASVSGGQKSQAVRLTVHAKPGVAPVRDARAQLLVGGLGCIERTSRR